MSSMGDKNPDVSSSKGRKRSHDEGVDGNASFVTNIVQCLARTDLECLITSSVVNQAPITVSDLTNALPESQQWKTKPKRKVAKICKGPSRVGTGSFDPVDDDLMVKIMGYLPLQDRIICSSKVCKAWTTFKSSADLWVDLTQFRPLAKGKTDMTFLTKNCKVLNVALCLGPVSG